MLPPSLTAIHFSPCCVLCMIVLIMDTLWFHAPGAKCLAEIPAKALLHAKVRDVEIAKTNSVLAHSLERSPVEGGSSTSSEQPTKSPDICFAHNCSPRNQRSKQMILNSFKIFWGEVQSFIYYRSGEGGRGGIKRWHFPAPSTMTSPTRLSGWWDLADGAGNKDDDGEDDCGKRWYFFASGCGRQGFFP